ncbi:MAG: hypothetical protein Q9175_008323, partial [Cornicularia normoerica]
PRGNVGSAVIATLLKEEGRFHITALTQSSSTYAPPSDSVKVIITDFESSVSLVAALQGQDALLCCVPGGATKYAAQKVLIDAAIEAEVKLFFASEFVADILSPHYRIFPTELVGDKVKTREYLQEKAKAGEIAWTALNGGPFFDMWLKHGFAGFDIPARRASIYGTGNNLACWTPLPIIATAVANMLHKPLANLNRGILISGVQNLTQNNLLAALEAEMGEKFSVDYIDVRKIKSDAMEKLEKGEWKAAARGLTISAQFNDEEGSANFWHLVENEGVGVQAVDVREAVREYLLWQKLK